MWNETNKEIARRLKDRRETLGYSFQQLAELTGMSKSTLQRYESGAIKNIPLARLEALTTALKTTPEQLLGWQMVQAMREAPGKAPLPDDYAALDALLHNLHYHIEERENGFYFSGNRQWGLLSSEEMAALRDKVVDYLEFLMSQIERDVFQKQSRSLGDVEKKDGGEG